MDKARTSIFEGNASSRLLRRTNLVASSGVVLRELRSATSTSERRGLQI